MKVKAMTEVKKVWYKALEPDELPEGRVKAVTCGLATVCMTHYEGPIRGARQRVSPPKRTSRRRLDREGLSALSVARLGLSSPYRQAARRL